MGKRKKVRITEDEVRVLEGEEEKSSGLDGRKHSKNLRQDYQSLGEDDYFEVLEERGSGLELELDKEMENENSGIEVLLEGDIVWGKAFPYTWWPALIKKIDHCGVLISFFGCKITRYFEESEMCSFEKKFQEMSNKMEGSLLAAVECALVELCRRVARGLSCPCQGSVECEKLRHPTRQIIQVKKLFQPIVVLDFVLRMAICTWVECGEELTVTRRATEVIAFRRYSYIKKDWNYQETMKLSESCSACDESDVTISGYLQKQCWSSFDDDTMPSVAEGLDFSKDQETKHELIPQKAESNLAICSMDMADFTALGSDEKLESMCENQAICNINMVDFSTFDSDENQIKDINMLSSSMDDDFVFVEEGFEVQNAAGVCARRQMNVEEMKKGTSGTELCLGSGPIVPAFCYTDKEKKPSCTSNFQGHSDRVGLESFTERTLETIEPQEGSITVVCRECKIDDSKKNLATLIPKKMDGKSAILDGPETILLRTNFVNRFYLNGSHDKTIDSDPLSKSFKIQPFLADSSFQDASTEVETQLSNDYRPVEPLVRSWAKSYLSEERVKQCLLEILTHLRCLALDPFYFSAGSTESEFQSMLNRFNFESGRPISVCQVILKYRCLIYHNICNFYPVKHICGHGHEVGKLHEIPQLDSTSQQCNLATEIQTEVELFSHNQEDASKNAHACVGETTEGSAVNVKVDCLSSYMPEIHTTEPVSKEELPATEPASEDPVRTHLLIWIGKASEPTGESQLQSSCTKDRINVHSCNTSSATSNITSKSESLETISKNSFHGKRQQHGHPVSSDSSLELLNSHPIFPFNRMYTSTLSMDTTVSNSNLLCQLSDGHSEVPTALHMKFPKNFNIPSKVELIKKFRPFGPVDYLRTRIFSNTGAAQVVFLDWLDAVAACRFSERKRLFGQTNVLFWLDRHEHSRRKTNMPAQLSSSGFGTSALNLKSCLKTSKSYGKSNKRKALRVKFVLEKNISSATTIAGKNTPFTDSDSTCNVWENTRPDISQQMLMLLEECNQLVCQIKDGFGLQSYYSATNEKLSG